MSDGFHNFLLLFGLDLKLGIGSNLKEVSQIQHMDGKVLSIEVLASFKVSQIRTI